MSEQAGKNAAQPENNENPEAAQLEVENEPIPGENTPASETAAHESGEDSFESQLEAAEQRLLRSQAELENFRKRTYRSMEEERKYASMPLLRDLLSVVDNLNRAIEAASEEEAAGGLVQGVQMVSEQLDNLLQQHQCEKIEARGLPFDPSMHDAIGQMPHPQVQAGHVCEVTQTGYRLHDRVVRPAQVFVSTGAPVADTGEN